MDFDESVKILCDLLKCNVTNLPNDKLRKLVHKRYLLWHPDKGSDKDKELFVSLNTAYNVFKKGPADASADLFCDEEFDFSDLSDDDSDYNDTPFSDSFFRMSPSKKIKVPEFLKQFLRAGSNRRAGKTFLLISDALIKNDFEKFLYKKIYMFADKDIFVTVIILKEHKKVSELKVHLLKWKKFKMDYCINYKVLINVLIEKFGAAEEMGVIEDDLKIEKKNFNYKMLNDFALLNEITDTLLLMEKYAHFANKCIETNPDNDHVEQHNEHFENASIFVHLADRHKASKAATTVVLARLHSLISSLPNVNYLEQKISAMCYSILENEKIILDAALWIKLYDKQFFEKLCHAVMDTFLIGNPKKRYIMFRGPFNSGKSTLAATFCRLFNGVHINLNVAKERISFHLGQAIGHRFVLFDDVKGLKSDDDLPPGCGMSNLDDLRDYIDGHIPVPLERKNMQPQQQIFPAGLITCNEYHVFPSLKQRIKIFKLKPLKGLRRHPTLAMNEETLATCLILLNLVPTEGDSIGQIVAASRRLLSAHEEACLWCKFQKKGKRF